MRCKLDWTPAKKARHSRGVGITLICAAVVASIWTLSTREPVYQGRSLKAWLTDFGQGNASDDAVAEQAIYKMFHPERPVWLQSFLDWIEIRIHVRIPWQVDHQRAEHVRANTMISLLSDADPFVRSGAARALEACPDEARRVVPVLIAHLQDPEQRTRLWVARSLGHMLSESRTVIPALIRALNDSDPNVRGYACISLEHFGTNAVEAVPILRKVIAKYGAQESWRAVDTLKAIAPESATADKH